MFILTTTPAHSEILAACADARFVQRATTASAYDTIVIEGRTGFIPAENGQTVTGDLYEINERPDVIDALLKVDSPTPSPTAWPWMPYLDKCPVDNGMVDVWVFVHSPIKYVLNVEPFTGDVMADPVAAADDATGNRLLLKGEFRHARSIWVAAFLMGINVVVDMFGEWWNTTPNIARPDTPTVCRQAYMAYIYAMQKDWAKATTVIYSACPTLAEKAL